MLIADTIGYHVHMGDIKNAYLYEATAEMVWTKCSPEFARVIIDGVECDIIIDGVECDMSGRKALIV